MVTWPATLRTRRTPPRHPARPAPGATAPVPDGYRPQHASTVPARTDLPPLDDEWVPGWDTLVVCSLSSVMLVLVLFVACTDVRGTGSGTGDAAHDWTVPQARTATTAAATSPGPP